MNDEWPSEPHNFANDLLMSCSANLDKSTHVRRCTTWYQWMEIKTSYCEINYCIGHAWEQKDSSRTVCRIPNWLHDWFKIRFFQKRMNDLLIAWCRFVKDQREHGTADTADSTLLWIIVWINRDRNKASVIIITILNYFFAVLWESCY